MMLLEPGAQDWAQRSRQAIWHPCTQMQQLEQHPPLAIARAEGAYLFDMAGRPYFDATSSWWVNLLGHNHPRLNAALCEQVGQLAHVMLAGFTHAPAVELAERLAAQTGLGHTFFASDGASAVEIALKMSFHAWHNQGQSQKSRFVCLQQSYHGETLGALQVTDVPLFRTVYAPLLQAARVVPSPDVRTAPPGLSPEQHALACAQALEQLLQEEGAHIAAVIVEPMVQGAAGMAMHHPLYLQRVRALCDQYQVHWIADEIAVGMGRTGPLWAHQHAGVQPDLLCLSKGITGGYLPLACVLCRDEIYQAFYHTEVGRGFLHSHSYTGNPLACRVALEVLRVLDEGVLAANAARAQAINAVLAPLAQHAQVRHFRHLGMIWAWDVPGLNGMALRQHLLAAGVALRPIGNTVYLLPPFCTTPDDVQPLVAAMLRYLEQNPQPAPGPDWALA